MKDRLGFARERLLKIKFALKWAFDFSINFARWA